MPTLVPVLYGLLAALFFGLGANLAKLGLRHTGSFTGTLISIGASTGLYWAAAPFFLTGADLQPAVVGIFAAIGCFQPIASANLANAGTHRLGPTVSSTAASISPLFAVAGGVLVLGEALTAPIAVGTAAIIAGVAVLSWRGRVAGRWLQWALLLPIGAALLRALAHVGAKGALTMVASPLLGGLVGYTVSLAIGSTLYLVRTPRSERIFPAPARRWFTLSGFANAGGIVSLYAGLAYGQVVLVSPIVSAAPLFTLLLSWLFFRAEVINRRTLAGVLLIVPGVVVISLYR